MKSLVLLLSVMGCASSHCPESLDEVNGACQCPEGTTPNAELRGCVFPDGSYIPWPDGVDVAIPDVGVMDAGADSGRSLDAGIDAPTDAGDDGGPDAGDDAMEPVDAGSDASMVCVESWKVNDELTCESPGDCPPLCDDDPSLDVACSGSGVCIAVPSA